MRLSLSLLIMLILPTVAFAQGLPDRVEGEFLLKVSDAVNLDGIENRVSEFAPISVKKVFKRTRILLVKATDKTFESRVRFAQLSRMMAKSGVVTRIEPNYLYYASAVPDDPRIGEMWFLPKISAPVAWDHQTDSPQVIVAVIDSGVFMDHEDLASQIWTNSGEIPDDQVDNDNNGYIDDIRGWDFYNDDNDPSADLVPVDQFPPFCIEHPTKKRYEAHGTHVAGTIGASGNNGKGIAGISWNVKIMPLKFLGGTCGSGSTSDAIEAIEYAIANGATIINNSWGGGTLSPFLHKALQEASDADILIPCAAGNSAINNDSNPHYPSSYDVANIIAVAATDQKDRLSVFGGGAGSNFGVTTVDLAAPGSAVLSTIPLGDESSVAPTSGYAAFRGTSMATPIVSGSAALIAGRFPGLSANAIKSLLLGTVDNIPALSSKVATGGRLNIAAAIDPPLPSSLQDAFDALPDEHKRIIQQPKQRMQLFLNKPFNFRAKSGVTGAMIEPYQSYHVIVQWEGNADHQEFLSNFVADLSDRSNEFTVSKVEKVYPNRPRIVIQADTTLSEGKLLKLIQSHSLVLMAEVDKQWRQD